MEMGYEITKGVGKVVQELQGMLELWSCRRQYRLLGYWVGDDCHWDGGWWVVRQGGGKRWERWERWSPRSGQRLKVLTLDLFFVLASKIIQALDSKPGSFNHTCISSPKCYLPWVMIWVMDSIPWVRCASGNVFFWFYFCLSFCPNIYRAATT